MSSAQFQKCMSYFYRVYVILFVFEAISSNNKIKMGNQTFLRIININLHSFVIIDGFAHISITIISVQIR